MLKQWFELFLKKKTDDVFAGLFSGNSLVVQISKSSVF
jgi:hypothetical protein